MTAGLAEKDAELILDARANGPFGSVEDVWQRSGVKRAALERLAEADAFHGLGLSRRQALWQVRGLRDRALPLFAAAGLQETSREPAVKLRPMTAGREVVEDYSSAGLSLRGHPVAFLREELERRRITRCADLARIKDGRRVEVAGLVLIRQRPGAGNVTFITIEDESGIANIILWQRRFEAQRRIVMAAPMIGVKGQVQREGSVIHVVADRLEDFGPLLASVGERDFPYRPGPADGARNGGYDAREKKQKAPVLPLPLPMPAAAEPKLKLRSRDFH
jgi:error-prone DNA polymerase